MHSRVARPARPRSRGRRRRCRHTIDGEWVAAGDPHQIPALATTVRNRAWMRRGCLPRRTGEEASGAVDSRHVRGKRVRRETATRRRAPRRRGREGRHSPDEKTGLASVGATGAAGLRGVEPASALGSLQGAPHPTSGSRSAGRRNRRSRRRRMEGRAGPAATRVGRGPPPRLGTPRAATVERAVGMGAVPRQTRDGTHPATPFPPRSHCPGGPRQPGFCSYQARLPPVEHIARGTLCAVCTKPAPCAAAGRPRARRGRI